MCKLYRILYVLAFVSGCASYAQDGGDLNTLTLNVDLMNRALSPSFTESQVQLQHRSKSESQVYIEQIGIGNAAKIDTQDGGTAIHISQLGDDNLALIKLSGSIATERLRQNGNNHTYFRYLDGYSGVQKTEVFQSGKNQNLTIHGANSLSKDMLVNMAGAQQAIIIRNFD